MNKDIVEENDLRGKWLVEGPHARRLIEPSEEYIASKEEEALLNSLIPTTDEIASAELEIKILNILMEVEVI